MRKTDDRDLNKCIRELRKENDRLAKQLERVKASKSVYMLTVSRSTGHNECISTMRKFYSTKQDALTDLAYEYKVTTGRNRDGISDSDYSAAKDGSWSIRLEITKVFVL